MMLPKLTVLFAVALAAFATDPDPGCTTEAPKLNCCNSVQNIGSLTTAQLLTLGGVLPINLAGIGCVTGVGQSCSTNTVCCQTQAIGTLAIALGCIII